MCVFHDHINSQTYIHTHTCTFQFASVLCLQHQVTHGMVLLALEISMQVDDDDWKICFRLTNYQVANCTCGGMASYANCKDLSIQQVEMVSFDKLFEFGI